MTKKFAVCAVLSISLLLFNCAGTQITSTADQSYLKKASRIFVLAELPTKGWVGPVLVKNQTQIAQDNYGTFKETFENKFKERGIECQCEVLTKLELDESIYTRKIKEFSPDVVLMINCVSITLQGSTMTESEYDLSFFDFETNKRFWRANLKANNVVMGMQLATGENVANIIFSKISDQLTKDKMRFF